MSTALFAQQRAAQQVSLAACFGCNVEDFDAAGRLAMVDRGLDAPWSYTALAVTFGRGVVLSIDPAYRAVIERLAPAAAGALRPPFLMKVIEESRSRGRLASAQGSAIGWALSAAPPVTSVPAGFNLRIEEGEWMRSEMVSGRWPNGLGYGPTGGIGGRAARNRFAAVIFDAVGAPVAVGGVMDTWGLLEVGVDVLEEYQGRGLGALVVQAATRAILDRGGVPLYGCAFDNIRSQRTALASGYLPTYAEAYVAG